MNKAELIDQLAHYKSFNDDEETHRLSMLYFLQTSDNCYDRSNLIGHVTASCFLLSPDIQKALLMHHAIWNMWVKMGGHCDGSEDVLAAAKREGEEESGIADLQLVQSGIFDIDVRAIPDLPAKQEPAHLHYDISYLFRAPTTQYVINHESFALEWLTPEEVLERQSKIHYHRMVEKWKNLKANTQFRLAI